MDSLRRRSLIGLHSAAMAIATLLVLPAGAQGPSLPATSGASASPGAPPPVVQKIEAANTKIEMTVNTSRILSMDKPIPRAQIANPELLDFTILSATQVQIHAKKAGITSVNLWDEKDEVHTVDVIISGDIRELDRLLRAQFPTASVKLFPTSASTLILSGYVDRPDSVHRLIRIAEDYYPKVINNITVGGSQQVLLHVKVFQVSRTKIRELGVNGAGFSGENFGAFTPAGLITKASATQDLLRNVTSFTSAGNETMQFGVLSNGNGFVGMVEALKQDDILKVLAEPELVTVSGRPANCLVGGKVAYPQPTGFGNISVAFQPFGTQIDFVPIVLGNGGCRLEVKPVVSEVDYTLGTSINGTTVPGFRVRQADTGVEMKFGQTLAIAGLLSQNSEAQRKGIPYLMDIPYVGALFRRTHNKVNEVELLILVQPELVEAMDCDQVPPCGPGTTSLSPLDCDLYFKGYNEVPAVVPGGGMGPGGPPGMMQEGMMGPGPEPTPAVEQMPSARVPARPGAMTVVSDRPADPRMASTRRTPPTAQPAPVVARPESQNPVNRQAPKMRQPATANSGPPGFIGPRGYEVRN